jgi:hypothetical protein
MKNGDPYRRAENLFSCPYGIWARFKKIGNADGRSSEA